MNMKKNTFQASSWMSRGGNMQICTDLHAYRKAEVHSLHWIVECKHKLPLGSLALIALLLVQAPPDLVLVKTQSMLGGFDISLLHARKSIISIAMDG